MTTYLLDVNLLPALSDPMHVHHDRLAEALDLDLPKEQQNRQAVRAIQIIGYRQGLKGEM